MCTLDQLEEHVGGPAEGQLDQHRTGAVELVAAQVIAEQSPGRRQLEAEPQLEPGLRREPTLEEIAEEASLPIQQAREVRAAARASASLDQPVGETDDAVFGDFVAGDGPLPEEQVELSLRSQALQEALLALPERERHVLVLRYGLADGEPRTLEEIGRRLGLTRERVRQIELDSLKRLAGLREMEAVS